MKTFEVLLKDPKPMGRPFVQTWITVKAKNKTAAKMEAESGIHGFQGWKAKRIRELKDNPMKKKRAKRTRSAAQKANDKRLGKMARERAAARRKKNPGRGIAVKWATNPRGSAAGFYVFRLDMTDNRLNYLVRLSANGLIWGARMRAWIMPENKAEDMARFAAQKDSTAYVYGRAPAKATAVEIRKHAGKT